MDENENARSKNLLRKLWLPTLVVVIVGYVGHTYKHYFIGTPAYKLSEEDVKLLKKALLEQAVIKHDEICSETTNSCYTMTDYVFLEGEEFTVMRMMVLNNAKPFSYSQTEVMLPKDMTIDKVNTRKWPVNKRKLASVYTKMMAGMGFVMEALSFEPKSMQQMLMIGLGGGVINNFLSTLGPETMINLTTVELDPEVFSLALDWFHLVETPTNRVVVGDGIEFIREASAKDDKYKVILIDACYDDFRPVFCPVEGFINPETIKDIANILDDDGILSVNVLTSSKEKGDGAKNILALYEKHFTSCFYTYITHPNKKVAAQQQLLFCTHRKNWSYREQESRFLRNLQRVDQTFDFELRGAYTTD
ncbi:hypothetical protein Y032_0095g2835 [Ancylostoma ceylanicum]|uniref:Spermine/spermidine synthase n=2 Tax=Ancylostoma ceylanicum TaxID=53326 RepID=A0A016TKJ6_9BILA|nr:hypothetical protein Y032_0095g2835 [Ancylostoma ceylanicum]